MSPSEQAALVDALALAMKVSALFGVLYALGAHWVTGRALYLAWRVWRRRRAVARRLRREAGA